MIQCVKLLGFSAWVWVVLVAGSLPQAWAAYSRQSFGQTSKNISYDYRPALVIIDMQDVFIKRTHAPRELVDNVLMEIGQSMKNGEWIMLVRFPVPEGTPQEQQNTDEMISFIGDYPNLIQITKGQSDGSLEIRDAFISRGLRPQNLKIAGIFTGRCVRQTVLGLDHLLNGVPLILLPDATSDFEEDWFYRGIFEMSQAPSVLFSKSRQGKIRDCTPGRLVGQRAFDAKNDEEGTIQCIDDFNGTADVRYDFPSGPPIIREVRADQLFLPVEFATKESAQGNVKFYRGDRVMDLSRDRAGVVSDVFQSGHVRVRYPDGGGFRFETAHPSYLVKASL